MTTPTFRDALEAALHRPVTEAEVSRAYRMVPTAGRLLRQATGPVARSEHPDEAVALVVVAMVARVLEAGAVLEFTDDDRRTLAKVAAAMRPPHPFTLA